MLKELLPRARMRKINSVTNFEEAIELASEPLLNKGFIEKEYIEAMIKSVYDFGPYIVLKDYFALPHARAGKWVNKQGMSLLYIDKPVLFIDKPVKLIIVLAAIDSTSHIEAIEKLAEILLDDEKYEVLLSGNLAKISNIMR